MKRGNESDADDAAEPSDRWLLVSDVDETITGDDPALRRFIAAVRRTPGLTVCLNSSRPFDSVERTLTGWHWRPDALITAMGTEIHIDGSAVAPWSQRFAGWDRSAVDAVMRRLGYPPHRAELQTPFKASFAVPHGRAQREAAEAIAATGLPVRIIASGQSDYDVLPPGAGKDHATVFLVDHLGLPLNRVVVAGDSLNDLAMFDVAERGIVVGNARDELRDALAGHDGVYFARRARADGVLEGMHYWGVPLPQCGAASSGAPCGSE